MDIRGMAIESLIAADPRRCIDKTLALLVDRADAAGAALFVARGGGPELVAGLGIDQITVDRVRATWQEKEQPLRAGRPAAMDSWCVWPLETERGPVGLVYVTALHTLPMGRLREAIAGLGDLLSIALRLEVLPAGAAAAVDSFLEEAPRDEIHRRQLVSLLDRNEWNIARVARLMGVTRRTIYNRIERLGIERRKIVKAIT